MRSGSTDAVSKFPRASCAGRRPGAGRWRRCTATHRSALPRAPNTFREKHAPCRAELPHRRAVSEDARSRRLAARGVPVTEMDPVSPGWRLPVFPPPRFRPHLQSRGLRSGEAPPRRGRSRCDGFRHCRAGPSGRRARQLKESGRATWRAELPPSPRRSEPFPGSPRRRLRSATPSARRLLPSRAPCTPRPATRLAGGATFTGRDSEDAGPHLAFPFSPAPRAAFPQPKDLTDPR